MWAGGTAWRPIVSAWSRASGHGSSARLGQAQCQSHILTLAVYRNRTRSTAIRLLQRRVCCQPKASERHGHQAFPIECQTNRRSPVGSVYIPAESLAQTGPPGRPKHLSSKKISPSGTLLACAPSPFASLHRRGVVMHAFRSRPRFDPGALTRRVSRRNRRTHTLTPQPESERAVSGFAVSYCSPSHHLGNAFPPPRDTPAARSSRRV